MNITDALKETGKATDKGSVGYVARNEEGILCWFTPAGSQEFPACLTDILGDFWVPYPYHPTPKKCAHCVEADRIESRWHRNDSFGLSLAGSLANHIRKDCSCKKEKP